MQLTMFAVRDRSADFHFPPFFMRSNVEAMRAFSQLINDKARSGAPSEYELVSLAIFDDQQGLVEIIPRVVLASGADVAAQAVTNG